MKRLPISKEGFKRIAQDGQRSQDEILQENVSNVKETIGNCISELQSAQYYVFHMVQQDKDLENVIAELKRIQGEL